VENTENCSLSSLRHVIYCFSCIGIFGTFFFGLTLPERRRGTDGRQVIYNRFNHGLLGLLVPIVPSCWVSLLLCY
jgi:hypothetical protein